MMILRKLLSFRGSLSSFIIHHSSFFLAAATLFLLAVFPGTPFAAEPPPIRSASEIDYPPFCTVDEKGRANGFSVELMRAALAAMGRDVEFRTGPWADVKGWLETGAVQALPLVGRTPEREELFDFTVPYISLHGAIVVRSDNADIHGMTDLRGRRVAVMKGDNAEEFIRREDRGIEIHTTATFEVALRELSEGLYDAVVVQRLVAIRLIQDSGLANLRVIDKPIDGFQQDWCFAVKEGDRETLALLNEGLALVTADGTYRHLHAKWFAALELPAGRRIVVGGDHEYPPFEYLDENGRPAGYNVDLTRAIAQEMGLDIEIRLGPWAEIVQGMEEGRVDVLQGMFYLPERDLKFDFTQAHTVHHYVSIVRRGEGDPPATLDDLAGKRIVVQRRDAAHDFLVGKGLAGQLSLADTQEEVLRELAEGKHDCALAIRITALYLIEEQGWKNLVLGRQEFLPLDYCYAAPNGHKAVLAQFSEGLKILDKNGEYHRIREKWIGGYEGSPIGFVEYIRYAAYIVLPLLLIIFAILFWTWSLRRQVARKTLELRQSLEFQKAMIVCSPVALYSVDPAGNVLSWNASAERIFGWRADEILGKPLPIVPEEKHAEFKMLRDQILSGQSFTGRELSRLRSGGIQISVSLSAAPIRDDRGEIIGIMSAAEDITERRQMGEALRKSEILYHSLFDHSLDAFLITILDGAILDANPAACKLFGRTVEEIKKAGRDDLVDITDPRLRKALEERAGTGKVHAEITMIRADQTKFQAEITSTVFTDQDGLKKTSMIIRDITERRRAEDELRDSRLRLKAIIESQDDAICRWLPDTTLTFANPTYLAVFGITEEEIGIRKWIDFVPPGDHEKIISLSRQLIEHRATMSHELPVRIKDGPIRWFAWVDTPIMDDQGRLLEIQSVGRDITDRKRVEAELAAQLDELRRWQVIMLDREDRVMELKREVNELLRRAGEAPRYGRNDER